jgi:SAM-dependent methyltransferase
MEKFSKKLTPGLKVLDVGSYDVNGNFKDLFKDQTYTGCDMSAGPNVDVVQESPFVLPFDDESFDVVISGNMFEHCEMPWLMALEMVRVLKKGGKLAVTTPWQIHYHPYPKDCWRISPDGMASLFGQWMLSVDQNPLVIIENRFDEIDTYFEAEKP